MRLKSTEFCSQLLSHHFGSDFICAFAYGSGVFQQKNVKKPAGMIDFLVVVEDADWSSWHARNRLRNPHDYPAHLNWSLPLFAKNSIYFIPNVPSRFDPKQRIKYGVVRYSALQNDLYTWSQLYLAGRLQKPTLQFNCSQSVIEGMDYNYDSALRIAMLLKSDADFRQVMEALVGLSYGGDPRLLLAEAPGKVKNIVDGQLEAFEELYLQRFEEARRHKLEFGDYLWRQMILNNVPLTLKQRLQNRDDPANISLAIRSIVKTSAWRQMLLGSISTPPLTALNYAASKISKRFS